MSKKYEKPYVRRWSHHLGKKVIIIERNDEFEGYYGYILEFNNDSDILEVLVNLGTRHCIRGYHIDDLREIHTEEREILTRLSKK